MASLIDNDHAREMSVQELLLSSVKEIQIDDSMRHFELTNALNDDALVRNIGKVLNVSDEAVFGLEYVMVAVIMEPFKSPFDGTTRMSYNMQMKISSTYIMAPKLLDVYTRNLAQKPSLANV